MDKKQYDSDYVSLRKNLLEQVKSKVQLIEGTDDPELKSYFLPYKSDLHEQKWFPVQRSEFIRDILSSDVIIGGDFHAFAQSQRTHLRIIRSLKKLNKPINLALECFESKDQKIIDDYLMGNLSEAELVDQTKWNEAWGFPFKNYLPLIKYAKLKGHKIIALNYKSSIEGEDSQFRDKHIAEKIISFRKEHDGLIYVVIGDLHIASPHLPKELKSLDPQLKLLSIFQNSEKLYFDLLDQGLESKVDIMKSSEGQYCILTSPPWVKWQNYLMFLEASDDVSFQDFEITFESDYDYDDEFDDGFIEEIDFTDQLYSIFNFLCKDLGFDLNFDHAEVFTELTDFLFERLKHELPVVEFDLVKELVENSKSFYLPRLGVLYLSRFTTNHASEVIGKYIQAELSGRKDNLLDVPNNFKPLIWVETLSYFMSKVFNHKRKTMSFKTLKSELLTITPEDSNHEILKFSLGHTMNEYFTAFNLNRSRLSLDPLLKPYSYAESARILGQFKGEQLFQRYTAGLFDKAYMSQLLRVDVLSDDFDDFYNSIVKVLLTKKTSKNKKEYIL